MPHYLSSEDLVEILSRLNDTDDAFDAFDHEDAFAAGCPPQNDDGNQVPQTVVRDTMPSQTQGIRDHYPASCRTDSTATVLVDKDAVTATATPTRDYILYHVNSNYEGDAEPLTEYAIAALNNDLRDKSYSGNVDEWVRDNVDEWARGRSQFPPSDPVDLNMSVFRSPRTRTDSTVGSSWTIVSSTTPSSSQTEHMADVICAAGLQFADVPAFPMGPTLLDKDLI
ncbi:hypothetical protein F4680DRAFT_199466 [Xylaria scruposa]|nr:hypothetical protein F4680DRAFT_199466 [Xylaria scruposa]